MLSQKLQKDLMNAYAAVHEEKRGHAAGASDTEKQASQLASDVRYKARGKVKDGASDEEKKKVFMQILGASPAPQAVKAMAKQKLLGEEIVQEMRFNDGKKGTEKRKEAVRKKRGLTKDQMDKHPQFKTEEFAKTGMAKGDGMSFPERLKMKAKKKKEKMSEDTKAMKAFLNKKAKKLQKEYDGQSKEEKNNPAFQSNKLNPKPQYNSHEPQGDVISEKKKESNPKNLTLPKGVKSGVDYTKTGSSTAYMGEAKKAKKDYDGDGKVESGTQEFLGSRDKAIKKAIAKRRGRVKEGFSAWRIDLDFNEQVKK